MGWKEVEERSGGAGAGFLAIKDGETKKIHIIDDEPFTFKSVFFNAIKKSAVVDPDNNPLDGMKGFDVRTRHAINVYDYDQQKVLVLAGSNELFNQLKAIHAEWQGFDQVDLKITRTGTGFDTKYRVVNTPKCIWNPDLAEGQEVADLATLFAPTPEETIMGYVQGKDPATEFNAAELEEEPTVDVEVDAVAESEEPLIEEETVAPPVRRPAPAPAKPAPKPAVNGKPLSRSELIMKLNHAAKSKVRYKKPGQWLADVKKFGGKDKTSMSQLGADALEKLLKFVNICK